MAHGQVRHLTSELAQCDNEIRSSERCCVRMGRLSCFVGVGVDVDVEDWGDSMIATQAAGCERRACVLQEHVVFCKTRVQASEQVRLVGL